MSNIPHSTLEVAPNTELPEPQIFAYYAPELYIDPDTDAYKFPHNGETYDPKPQATICGLQRRRFWILAIVAFIVVAGAVGGGVGGALASASSNKRSAMTGNTPQPVSPSSTPAVISTSPVISTSLFSSTATGSSSIASTPTVIESRTSITATTIVGPTSTIVRDCPSSNDTLYDVTLGNTKMTFRKECGISIANTKTNQNAIVKVVSSLDECIDLCAAYNINNRTRIASGTDKICNSVCWRNTFDKTNDWPGGMCFGYAGQNTGDTFKYSLPAETRYEYV